ncbi:glutathionylspermidine synthase family protein [Pseudomonas sp. MAFF212428]|uniref:Glutathionylspermidine synthase family protein n=1 Tax=Pseudomonas brassicae TaxID=2708063 RepID=A0A6B3NNE3_9PSED|nr:glutathionylspermidine synthase family protein [Pseudomonas brassicae]NER60144.1 glutathionylspermidine synthase family protein [Pseudomonas brassicae]NER63133.1 glutathionylspermidine synthase family protein [Pseudomonas brassicae]
MKRIACTPRGDWKATAERYGFTFHTFGNEPYWDESAYYQFSLRQIEDELEEPTRQLHELCMELVERVVDSEELLERLAIPRDYRDLVRRSWREGHPHFYGRMDLSYDGRGPAKLLEANYDTPTSLYEAGFFQYLWLEQQIRRGVLPAGADQFNSLEEKLGQVFTANTFATPFYFASVKASLEDRGTVEYLRDIAAAAGLDTRLVDVEDIGLNASGRFVDPRGAPIPSLFKLYPWEDMFRDRFGPAIAASGTLFVEPPWKAVLSNKGMLALLWEQHHGHPHLLPAFMDTSPERTVAKGWVRKPFFSREGANVEIHAHDGQRVKEGGPYGGGPNVIQQFHALPQFAGSYTVIGSWMVGDQPAGIGIREDHSLITKDSSRFLPHAIID